MAIVAENGGPKNGQNFDATVLSSDSNGKPVEESTAIDGGNTISQLQNDDRTVDGECDQQSELENGAADLSTVKNDETHIQLNGLDSNQQPPPMAKSDHQMNFAKVNGANDMSELVDMLSKLNPMAQEFVPPSLAKNHGFWDNGFGYVNNFGMVSPPNGNANGNMKRKNSFNQGRKRTNNRRGMAQREDVIRRTVYVSDIDQQVVDCRICGDPNSVLRFAFIEFTDEEGARVALNLSGTVLGYYPLRVLPSKTAIAPVNPTFLPRISQADVRLFFESFCGEVHCLRLLGDYHHSTRIAFVEFAMAESAIVALNCSGAVLGSLPIRVSPSKTPLFVIMAIVAENGGPKNGVTGQNFDATVLSSDSNGVENTKPIDESTAIDTGDTISQPQNDDRTVDDGKCDQQSELENGASDVSTDSNQQQPPTAKSDGFEGADHQMNFAKVNGANDMSELVDMLSKLNPMAQEFVPPSLAKNHAFWDNGFGYPNNFGMLNPNGNANGNTKRKNNFNQGRRRTNSRRSMAQREDVIRRTVYVSDIDQQVTEEQLAGLFIHCGQVVDCRICGDPNSVLRFAFIEFTDEDGARVALNLSGTVLGYYPLRVLPSKTAIAPVNPTFLPRISQADVRLFFESFCGEVQCLRLLGDYHHSTRIAFVEFAMAESAIAALNCSGAVLGSLPIRYSRAGKPLEDTSSPTCSSTNINALNLMREWYGMDGPSGGRKRMQADGVAGILGVVNKSPERLQHYATSIFDGFAFQITEASERVEEEESGDRFFHVPEVLVSEADFGIDLDELPEMCGVPKEFYDWTSTLEELFGSDVRDLRSRLRKKRIWLNIVEVVHDDGQMQFSVGITSADFPLDGFDETPQCGCGFNCNGLVSSL
ncbi:Polyadenylate-binding protein-interacting protein 10 [Linum grandiflorum]